MASADMYLCVCVIWDLACLIRVHDTVLGHESSHHEACCSESKGLHTTFGFGWPNLGEFLRDVNSDRKFFTHPARFAGPAPHPKLDELGSGKAEIARPFARSLLRLLYKTCESLRLDLKEVRKLGGRRLRPLASPEFPRYIGHSTKLSPPARCPFTNFFLGGFPSKN